MAYGTVNRGKDGFVRFGFSNIQDWLNSIILSFPAPWTIGDDTMYGTEIVDADGVKLFNIWIASGRPSERERHGMTDEQWDEYCSDSHWESEAQWYLANAIIALRNTIEAGGYSEWERELEILRTLIFKHCRWAEEVNDEIKCGGPNRRLTDEEAWETGLAASPTFKPIRYDNRKNLKLDASVDATGSK